MIPDLVYIVAIVIVGIAAFIVLRQNTAAFATGLRAKIAALQTHLDAREKLLADNGKLQTRYAFLKEICTGLSTKEERLREDVGALEPRAAAIEEKVRALAEERSTLEQSIQGYEEEKRKWEDRIKELDRLDELIGKSAEKRNEINQEISQAEKKIKDLEKQVAEVEESEKKLEQLKVELAEAETARDDTAQEVGKLEGEKSKLEKDVGDAEDALKNLEDRRISVEAIVEAMGGGSSTRVVTEETFSSLFEPEFTPAGDLLKVSPDQRFAGFMDYLEDHAYSFSERLINAFHTSLKVQDVSCLTVMAGISGTGKSALPRLYADYMGMHFLLVPVEPRWDSPQDLFGFLNYMENRYEATPLGRALNQFNMRDKVKASSMQDEILLVLLDEMNLARVEYYFSEFLSRLEARRDLDWKNDKEAYQKVSLEIFAGSSKAQDEENNVIGLAPIRLFAGPNILFVGTMNEDESTQNLTDKVVDRSNAIHFGRPQSLMARKGKTASATQEKLSYQSWQSHLRAELNHGTKAAKDVNEFLSVLNDRFDALGRPFGHRAFAATCSYVANHPMGLRDELSELRSLADQVAMRFLPKLRGIDLNEHQSALDSVRSHLSVLNDQAVLNAFDASNDRTKGYFQWRGIDWNLK